MTQVAHSGWPGLGPLFLLAGVSGYPVVTDNPFSSFAHKIIFSKINLIMSHLLKSKWAITVPK